VSNTAWVPYWPSAQSVYRVFRCVLSTFVHQQFQIFSGKLKRREWKPWKIQREFLYKWVATYVLFSQGMSRERVPRVLSLPIGKVVEGGYEHFHFRQNSKPSLSGLGIVNDFGRSLEVRDMTCRDFRCVTKRKIDPPKTKD